MSLPTGRIDVSVAGLARNDPVSGDRSTSSRREADHGRSPSGLREPTSRDLGSYRKAVADVLRPLDVHAVIQDDFPPDYRSVVGMLRDRIEPCDAIICLVGRRLRLRARTAAGRRTEAVIHPARVRDRRLAQEAAFRLPRPGWLPGRQPRR